MRRQRTAARLVASLSLLLAGAGPMASYGPDPARPGAPDLEIRRLADGTVRPFTLTARGTRDGGAIARFLGSGRGRVTRLFDKTGHHDLTPQAGTVGPLVLAGNDLGDMIGLRFDNDGAFEGNPTASGGQYYAVSLGNPDLALTLHDGVTVLATARTGNIVSTALAALLCLGCRNAYPLLLLAGDGDPATPAAASEDLSLFYGRSYAAGPGLRSTPDAIGFAIDGRGISGLAGGRIRSSTQSIPTNTRLDGMLLGTAMPGGGAGWEFGRLELYASRLPTDALEHAGDRLRRKLPDTSRGVLVLDGSSVEAGVGSTALRNLTRLYETALPGTAIYNVAVGGARTADRIAALPATLALFAGASGTSVLLCGIGANSLGSGIPAEQAYAQLTAYVALAHTARPGLIVGVTTLIPNGPAIDYGHGAQFPAYNRLVLRNRAGADFVIDRAADPLLGDPARYRPVPDRRLTEDGAHPTDAGTALLAARDLASLRPILLGPPPASASRRRPAQPASTSLR